MKLNLGCGGQTIDRPGWVNVDLNPAGPEVIAADIRGPFSFAGPGEVEEIVSSHSLEHLEDPREALAFWHSLLSPGGTLVIAIPDAAHKAEWIGVHLATVAARGKDVEHLEDHHADLSAADLVRLLHEVGEWTSVEVIDPYDDWRIPGKAWWQACVRATR